MPDEEKKAPSTTEDAKTNAKINTATVSTEAEITQAMSALSKQYAASREAIIRKFGRSVIKEWEAGPDGDISKIFNEAAKLPKIKSPRDWLSERQKLDPFLIEGVLRERSKGSITSVSKGGKTWLLLGLALCVGSGKPWLDHVTKRTSVLYVNLELKENTMQDRVLSVCEKLGIDPSGGHDVDFWHLRGFSADVRVKVDRVLEQFDKKKYGLVIIDPTYKMLGGRNENAAGDITAFMNELEKIATEGGAAILAVGHAPKGDLSNRSGLDMQSGSGVFARDPDVIITFRPPNDGDMESNGFNEDHNMITVDFSGMREDVTPKPFFARWDCPIFLRIAGEPTKVQSGPGRRSKYSADDVLSVLVKAKKPLSSGEWQKLANKEIGIGYTTFHKLKNELFEAGAFHWNKEEQTASAMPKLDRLRTEPTGLN